MVGERGISQVSTPDELSPYRRKYAAWTEQGMKAFQATREYRHTLFGGGQGGSKTVTGVRIFQTDISNYSNGVFVVIRKNYTVLENTSKQTFHKFFPPDLVHTKTQDKWFCVNGNQIWFFAADKSRDKHYEKLRGLEASAFMVDEASEFDDEFFEILPARLRQPAIHLDTGQELRPYIYYTTNPKPGKNFLKRTFIDPKTRVNDGRHVFIKSLAKDNPFNPKGYASEAFADMTEPMRRMLQDGDWDVDASEFVIIPQNSIDDITVEKSSSRVPVCGGIDIGLGSPDQTVIYAANAQGQMFVYDLFSEYDTMVQVEKILPFCDAVRANKGLIYIDSGAVGKGAADRLSEIYGPQMIKPVNFGEGPEDEKRRKTTKVFSNRRAQLYWWAREDAIDKKFKVERSEELFEEIENTWYDEKANTIKIVPKEEIKKRLGHSPDRADAFVLANAARRKFTAVASSTMPSVATTTKRRNNNYSGY